MKLAKVAINYHWRYNVCFPIVSMWSTRGALRLYSLSWWELNSTCGFKACRRDQSIRYSDIIVILFHKLQRIWLMFRMINDTTLELRGDRKSSLSFQNSIWTDDKCLDWPDSIVHSFFILPFRLNPVTDGIFFTISTVVSLLCVRCTDFIEPYLFTTDTYTIIVEHSKNNFNLNN